MHQIKQELQNAREMGKTYVSGFRNYADAGPEARLNLLHWLPGSEIDNPL
jgi:hypothetical protein